MAGDVDATDKLLYLNLAAPMRLTRVLAPAMAKKGDCVIINISSVAGDLPPLNNGSAGSSSKGHHRYCIPLWRFLL